MRTSYLLTSIALASALQSVSVTPAHSAAVSATLSPAARQTVTAGLLAAGQPYAGWASSGRQFVEFDQSAGTAVEILGDLTRADRIAVLVPGVDTQLADFDQGLGGESRRAPSMQARSILAELHSDDPTANVAVVAWLGYHPPDGIDLDAVRETRAREGADALVSFVHGVLQQRPQADITLVGHSYGSIVVGLAAASLPEVQDVVVLGAPGMGVDAASELPGTRVWSALADGDWISRLPEVRLFGLGHGRRPSSPGFGATLLPTSGVHEHDGYLVAGTATLGAVARVVLDQFQS